MIDRLNRALEGRYRIARELGEGGMATVYLADDVRHNRRVAIKVLKPELAAVVGSERFLTEIETTAALQHPHILPLFDSGEADGFLFYVMPFVDGESLRDRIDRDRQLPVDEAVGIAAKIAGALQVAHASGVIHRDIKPANILLANGEPLIADFGIALAVQEAGGGRLTETGLSVGTPFYMSPEQATADRAISPATDIYAMGCVLYEMLVGEPPYVGNSAQAVLGKILTEDPRRPTAVRPRIRPNVEAAVMRALEKLPADRFGSVSEFLRALEDPGFRHGDEVVIGGASGRGGSPVWKWVAAGLGVAVVALAATHLIPSDPPPAPVVRLQVPLPEGVSADFDQGVGVEVSPEGDAIVFRGTVDGELHLWLHRLDRLEPEIIGGTEGARNPRFSPDGRSVVFHRDGLLQRVALDGSPVVTLISDGVAQRGLAWGDDGYIYYGTEEAEGVWRVPAAGGSPAAVPGVDGDLPRATWPDLLPGGRGLLTTLNYGTPDDDSVAVQDLESGEVRILAQGAMARWSTSGHLVYASGESTLLAVPFDPERLEVTGEPRPRFEGVRVNTGSAAQFAISRSGTLVYGSGESRAGADLFWVGPEGTAVAAGDGDTRVVLQKSISPDGTRVALSLGDVETQGIDIWVLDLEGGVFSRITFEGQNYAPFWHPDSEVVGFLRSGDGMTRGLYSRPTDLSTEAELLWTIEGEQGSAGPFMTGAWTPDGARLVVNIDYDSIVTVAPHPDSTATRVVAPPGQTGSFDLSPNGDWIAYDSDESGRPEIYVRPFPGPGGQRQISSGGGVVPKWLESGDGIVYGGDGRDAWILAELAGQDDPRRISEEIHLSASSPELAENAIYDWDLAPDGRVLTLGVSRGDQRAPFVVTNWLSEWVGSEGRR